MSLRARVLIADGQPILRAGMRASLQEARFEVVGETVDQPTTLAAVVAQRPDVCLVDCDLDGGCSSVVRAIRRRDADVAVLVLADRADSRALIDSLRAGASGYLVKDVDLDQLPRAISAVLAGEVVVPRRFVAGLVEELRNSTPHVAVQSRFAALTKREQEVVDMLRAGWSTSRIADQLFVAPVTVRTHVSAILGKLQLPDRKALLDVAPVQSHNRV